MLSLNKMFVCLFVGITKGQGPVFISFIGQTGSKLFYILHDHNEGLLVYFVLIFTPYCNSTILLHKSAQLRMDGRYCSRGGGNKKSHKIT